MRLQVLCKSSNVAKSSMLSWRTDAEFVIRRDLLSWAHAEFLASETAAGSGVLPAPECQRKAGLSARRVHLLELLWRERYVTLASLVWRVEIIMAYACFGEESWEGSFHKEGRA